MIKSLSVGITIFWLTSFAQGQTIERDYSKYLRPLIFVVPEAPVTIDTNPSRKYAATVNILANGTVKLPILIDPAEPLMTASVNDAARFWVFAPDMTSDCQAGPRSGRVGFEYDSPTGRTWLELPQISASDSKYRYKIIHRDTAYYPRSETSGDINKAEVTVAIKFMPDGTVGNASIFIAIPSNKSFIAAALKGARSTVIKFKEPIEKPFLCALVTYSFSLN